MRGHHNEAVSDCSSLLTAQVLLGEVHQVPGERTRALVDGLAEFDLLQQCTVGGKATFAAVHKRDGVGRLIPVTP